MDSVVEIAPSEKHNVDYLGDLYAVIVAIERLEKAHYRDLIRSDQYNTALRRLLDKYRSVIEHLRAAAATSTTLFSFAEETSSLDQFFAMYCQNCAAARIRIRQGHPEDIADAKEKEAKERELEGRGVNPKTVLEAGQYFITLMDCLKLQQTAVDTLLPIVADLIEAVERLQAQARTSPHAQGLPPEELEFQFLPKLRKWAEKLESMHASDEVNEREAREMTFDVERGYHALYKQLQSLSGDRTAPRGRAASSASPA